MIPTVVGREATGLAVSVQAGSECDALMKPWRWTVRRTSCVFSFLHR